MKILYAIQGTGNGHLSRAQDIVPVLQKKGEVDIVVSGTQADVTLPYPIKYKLRGFSFIFGKKGGVDVWRTYLKSNAKKLYIDIKKIPVEDYDLILNDFEPVSAWAAYLKKIPCIGLSHQAAVLNRKAPKPKKKDRLGSMVLKKYAPTSKEYGFHFKSYDQNIFTPIIRKRIRDLSPGNEGHYTVYLPAYDDKKLLKSLSKFKKTKWEVFSKHNHKEVKLNNVMIKPVSNEAFLESFRTCEGILCGAGFETPAEALFLQKKLMVIPMKGQYEQQCNAAALKEMGIPVVKSLKTKHHLKIDNWLESDQSIAVDYPDETEEIIDHVIENSSHHVDESHNIHPEVDYFLK
ncbi:glycosyltransferase family protein [Fulvivirgaceae bacterium BMA12]|uniref:Glycosyltransferase family protein n=1 Tax=Agaribacillus aureus TaxID=3051825 RepID=A0ABT8L9V7_9BACT|nr:glycosyltransferase family protein [Fulvivirgaceae bacterium BMA12]